MFKLSKRLKWWLAGLIALMLMAATVPLAIWVTHTAGAQLENARRRCERREHASRTVVIYDNRVVPAHTEARLCDDLVITNRGATTRLIAFGEHDSHTSYDGVSESLLGTGDSLKVVLIKDGSYKFHDHDNEAVKGTFRVAQ